MQNAITDAVRRLRVSLGDTQQQFAARTGLAISTVVRYELSRPPKGQALQQFKDLADQHGFHDIARTFAYAMGQSPETAVLHAAFDTLWWNRQSLTGWPMLANRLTTEFEKLIEAKRQQPDSIAEPLETLEAQLILLRSLLFGTAWDQLNEAAASIAARQPKLTWEEALDKAMTENPELCRQYDQEKADAARGTSVESSFAVYGTLQHAARRRKEKKS